MNSRGRLRLGYKGVEVFVAIRENVGIMTSRYISKRVQRHTNTPSPAHSGSYWQLQIHDNQPPA